MDKDYLLAISEYLTRGVYPDNLSKGERRTMRKCAESFVCNNGILYHLGKEGRQQLVVIDPAEKQRVVVAMHLCTPNRIHNGVNVTVHKILEWYWWRGVTEDVRAYCKTCSECAGFFDSSNWAPVYKQQVMCDEERSEAQTSTNNVAFYISTQQQSQISQPAGGHESVSSGQLQLSGQRQLPTSQRGQMNNTSQLMIDQAGNQTRMSVDGNIVNQGQGSYQGQTMNQCSLSVGQDYINSLQSTAHIQSVGHIQSTGQPISLGQINFNQWESFSSSLTNQSQQSTTTTLCVSEDTKTSVLSSGRELVCRKHARQLLQALERLYVEKICCDVIVSVAGGWRLQAHKIVLMAGSDYFRTAITEQYHQQTSTDVIHLSNVNAASLELIISYLYCGKLHLHSDNAVLLLATATQLGIQSAVELCRQYLSNPHDLPVKCDRTEVDEDEDTTELNITNIIASRSKEMKVVGACEPFIKTEQRTERASDPSPPPLHSQLSIGQSGRKSHRSSVTRMSTTHNKTRALKRKVSSIDKEQAVVVQPTRTTAPSVVSSLVSVARKRGRPRKVETLTAPVVVPVINIKREKMESVVGVNDGSDSDTRDNDWMPSSAKKKKISLRGSFPRISAPVKKTGIGGPGRRCKLSTKTVSKKKSVDKLKPKRVAKIIKKVTVVEDKRKVVNPVDNTSKMRRRLMSADICSYMVMKEGVAHRCVICDAGFAFHFGLERHQRMEHRFIRTDLASFRLSRRSINAALLRQLYLQSGTGGGGGEGGGEMKEDDRRPLVCEVCVINFTSKTRYLAHRLSHEKQFEKKMTTKKKRSDRHLLTWRPPITLRLFSSWVRLLRQERVRTMTSSHGRLMSNRSAGSQLEHRSGSSGEIGSGGCSVFSNRCGWCGTSYINRAELLEHRRLVHAPKPKPVGMWGGLERGGAVEGQRVRRTHLDWTCKERDCPAPDCKNKDALKLHMATTHPHVIINCPSCRFKTQLDYFLKRHMVKRHKVRQRCEVCGRGFHKRFILKVHMYNQHKISDPSLKLYQCAHEGCGYASPSKNGLRLHTLKHNIAKPYTCHICGKTFKRPETMERHIGKIHLGIRPYICDKCGVSYSSETELKRHVARHDSHKPFSCEFCTFSAYEKSTLQSHLFCRHKVLMNQKTPVMSCDQCDFTTDKKCRFTDHMRMHGNVRDIPCPECGKLFCTKKTMRQHIGKVHKHTTQRCPYCAFTAILPARMAEHMRMMHMAHNSSDVIDAASDAAAVVQQDQKVSTLSLVLNNRQQQPLSGSTSSSQTTLICSPGVFTTQQQQHQHVLLRAQQHIAQSTVSLNINTTPTHVVVGGVLHVAPTVATPVTLHTSSSVGLALPSSQPPIYQAIMPNISTSTAGVQMGVVVEHGVVGGNGAIDSEQYQYSQTNSPFERRLHVL